MKRRKFLQTSATSAAAASLPTFSIDQTDAGKKLNVALIGGLGIARTLYFRIPISQGKKGRD